MFPEGMDMNALLQQAQAFQSELQQKQAELASTNFTGSAGGDLVTATVTGSLDLVGLQIKPEAVDPDDVDTLADLVVAAVREASSQAKAKMQAAMPDMPDMGGLGF